MSGSGFKSWSTGDVVTSAEFNGYLMKQALMYFADATARDAAITTPEEGMHAYLADTNTVTYYDGDEWLTAFIKQELADAKGDLIVASGADVFVRVAVGADGSALIADSSQSAGVKWGSSVTDRTVVPGFSEGNVQANVSASQLWRVVGAATSSVGTAQLPVVADRSGSIVGVSVALEAARTGGTLTVEAYINGTATGLTVTIDATNTQHHYAVQASGLDTFAAGDRLDLRYTTSAFAPTSSQSLEAVLTVQYA